MNDQIKHLTDENVDFIQGVASLAGLGAVAKRQINQQIVKSVEKKLKLDSLTRDQKILMAMLSKLDPSTRQMLASGNYKVTDFELYATAFIGSTGASATQSTIKLIKASDEDIEGVRTFNNLNIPSQSNCLVTGLGIEIAAIPSADIASLPSMTATNELIVNYLTFDSTQLITSKPNQPALLNGRRFGLPEILMNSKFRITVDNKLMEESENRNLSNSGGAYAAARGIYDIKRLQTPFLIRDRNNVGLELELPRNGTFPQIDTTPTAAAAVFGDAAFYIKVRLQTIMISPR